MDDPSRCGKRGRDTHGLIFGTINAEFDHLRAHLDYHVGVGRLFGNDCALTDQRSENFVEKRLIERRFLWFGYVQAMPAWNTGGNGFSNVFRNDFPVCGSL